MGPKLADTQCGFNAFPATRQGPSFSYGRFRHSPRMLWNPRRHSVRVKANPVEADCTLLPAALLLVRKCPVRCPV
jgi:hypothetical protein